ncbi:MAG TPA: IS5 family transposase [Candidatus Nanoarchaeia archaeon]|nr:IS5 family transposase [Candidatus Nanoarchaeia archaeon]
MKQTYKQEWKAYNLAQQNEGRLFLNLLAEAVAYIKNPTYKFGRPTLPLSEMVYAMVYKVYSTFSGRRFNSQLQWAYEKGHLENLPHYNSIFNYFQNKELTPILKELVALTSAPLWFLETNIAIDATGFGTKNYQCWFSVRKGKNTEKQNWVKLHFTVGTKTNIITAVEVTKSNFHEGKLLKPLLIRTAEHFYIKEVSGDKAYLSENNLKVIHELGAEPYIPFKSNSKPTGHGMLWKKLYHYFNCRQEEFMEHYHQRSNVEATVQMLKSKFGSSVRSKKWEAQVNEVLCKAIAHNICVIIQQRYEMGMEPNLS